MKDPTGTSVLVGPLPSTPTVLSMFLSVVGPLGLSSGRREDGSRAATRSSGGIWSYFLQGPRNRCGSKVHSVFRRGERRVGRQEVGSSRSSVESETPDSSPDARTPCPILWTDVPVRSGFPVLPLTHFRPPCPSSPRPFGCLRFDRPPTNHP